VCLGLAQQNPRIDPKYVPLAEQLFSAADDPARAVLLDAHKDLLDPKLVGTMNEIAGQVFDKEDYEHAMPMYGVACGIAERVGDKHGQAVCANNIGLCLSRLYRNEEALAHFDRAITITDSLGVPSDLVKTLNAIGVNFHRSGDFNTALPYLQRAVDEAERAKDTIGVAQSNTNLGNLYKETGRYRDAIRSFLRALELIRDDPSLERRVAMVLNNLGGAYFDQRDLDLAVSYHEQARAIKEKLHTPPSEQATTVMNLGVDYQNLGNLPKAFSYLDRALQLTDNGPDLRIRTQVLYNYGSALHESGRNAEASVKLKEALQIADRITDHATAAVVHVDLSEIAFEEARYQDAVNEAGPVADFARRENVPRTLIRADDVLGMALQKLGRNAEAEAALEEAIRFIEQARAELPGERQALARFMSDQIAAYRHMVQIQVENGRPEVALGYSERSKGRTLLDVLQSGGNPVAKSMTPQERATESALSARLTSINEQSIAASQRPIPDRKRLTALGAETEKARNEYRMFEVALYAAHPELKVQRVAFEPSASRDLASSLPDSDAAMLEYAITDSGPVLFVVTRSAEGSRLKMYRIAGTQEALTRDILNFRNQIAGRDLNYRKLAASLYKQLIEPAREDLRGKSTLVIVPDGALWQLPFQALEVSPDRYVLQDYAVFYTPSLSVLHEMQKVHQARQLRRPNLLAVGASLAPVTRREVEGLRQLYGAANVRIFSGPDADEDRIKREAPNYRILHFAAHGVFEDRNPMESYLVLAKAGKPEAGLLQAREMMNLDLRADMVVLSGCETGRGNTGTGEGLIGMAWALFIAGSPATVASQWKVEAESTSQFMLDFHRRLRLSNKSRALQQAALSVMRKPEFRHPFYWSGFVLLGEGF
jgi:CHAT domain-containing protein/Tfp pilus assembly protein PilF